MAHAASRPVFAAERAARRAAMRAMDRNLAYFAAHPEEIDARLEELDAEMDVERAMDVYALRAAAIGGVLSLVRSRSWALLPLAAAAMLALQAATGDSALRLLLRRRGYRTLAEIHAEADALWALRDARETPLPAAAPPGARQGGDVTRKGGDAALI